MTRAALQPARWRDATKQHAFSIMARFVSGEQRFPWFPVSAVVVLVVAGFWTRHAINESLVHIVSEKLQTILDTDVMALQIWIDNERQFVESWANENDAYGTRSETHAGWSGHCRRRVVCASR